MSALPSAQFRHFQRPHAIALRKYPGRPILLIACNERGHAIHVTGVWYARQLVWNRPTTNPAGAGQWVDFIESK